MLCFSIIKYFWKVYLFPLYGKTQKDSAFPKQTVNFSCVSGSGRPGCMIDYIFGNTYTIHNMHIISCVCDNIFQRICEHTALEQMCTTETGQRIRIFLHNHETVKRVFNHLRKEVEGCLQSSKSPPAY